MSNLERYRRANAYINEGLIRVGVEAAATRTRREWMNELFLPRLGHPQRAFPAIHVGGTSGKGSVCVMIAEILRAAGLRVGLHVSPYVQVATEKLWVDGRYASAAQYAELVDWIRPIAESCRGDDVPLHGMASVGLCLEYFRRQRVDIGVVEVGVGGRNDLTNVLQTRVAAITNVGLDHTASLGPTLEDIAHHKVGIIQPGCRAVVFAPDEADPLMVAATRRAREVSAPLRVVGAPDVDALPGTPLAMAGAFQARNAALALAACEELAESMHLARCAAPAAMSALSKARLPGRAERVPRELTGRCPVLLDGAHNPAKLAALCAHLREIRAPPPRARLHLLYGTLQSKSHAGSLATLVRHADSVVLTEPRVYAKTAQSAREIATALARETSTPIVIEVDPLCALDRVLAQADARDLIVVTGSFYLVGAIRGRWYPGDQVLRRRSSW